MKISWRVLFSSEEIEKKKKWEEHWINKTVLSAMRIIIYIEIWNPAVFCGVLISPNLQHAAQRWPESSRENLIKNHLRLHLIESNWFSVFFIPIHFHVNYKHTFLLFKMFFYSTVFSFIFSFFVSFGWDWVPSKCFLIENDSFWVWKGIWIDLGLYT